MAGRRHACAAFATLLCLAGASAHAAHPLITEDPGTQGAGRWEAELAWQGTRHDPSAGRATEWSLQLSWGALPTLDVIVRPTWLSQRPQDGATERGMGDTVLAAKWRFHESGNLALAVRAGLGLPTGSEAKGLGAARTGAHALLAASLAVGSASLLGNVGVEYSRETGERDWVPHVSAALLIPAEAAVRTFIEVAAQANSDRSRSTWPTIARTGLLWKATEALDLDVGIEAGLNRAAPDFTLLAGATLRW